MAVTGRSVPSRVRSLRTFQAFQNRQFRLLWPANLFNNISRWSQMTLLAWLVLELTESPWRVSLVGACGFAPTLVLGAIGGLLADRVDRKRLLIVTQTANLIVTLVMTVVLFTGRVEFWHAYIVILANGTGSALDFPSRRSIVHDLMGRAGVTNAIAVDSMGMHASRMAGPALAGLLISTVDVSGAYIVVTGFHVATFTLTTLLRLPERRTGTESHQIVGRRQEPGRGVPVRSGAEHHPDGGDRHGADEPAALSLPADGAGHREERPGGGAHADGAAAGDGGVRGAHRRGGHGVEAEHLVPRALLPGRVDPVAAGDTVLLGVDRCTGCPCRSC